MFRKILPLILMLVLLCLPGKVQAGKDYVAERFDVDIILNTDGSMQVTETIAFRFMGGPFSYVYRDLEKTRTDGITFTSAELDGRPLPVNGENAIEWVEVNEGDPLSVKWHFEPTTDQIRIYTLMYQVSGIVRKGDMDSIVWMAIPPEHEYRSQTSRITVAYPDGAIPAGQPLLEGSASYLVESDGNPFVLTSGPVEVDTPLVLTLNFNAGTLSTSVPAWQADEQVRQERSKNTTPYIFIGLAGGLAALLVMLGLLLRTPNEADGVSLPPTAAKPVSPPTDYKPAVAAALVARNTPSMAHTLATLIDLAQKGAVSIEQLPGKWYSSHRFELVRLPYSSLLDKHEQVLMDALFTKRGQPVERIELSQYSQALGKSWSSFSKTIQAEITALGLISPERKKTQSRVMIIGGVLILIGILFVITLAIAMNSISSDLSLNINQAASALLGVSISAGIAGFIYVIAGALFSTLSSRGRWIADQWSGFSKYLKDIIAQREHALRPDTFTQFLPFAAGFGLGSQWAKSFRKRGFTDVPVWFHALNAQDAETSFGAFASFMTSSSSNASSGGGGGGGASGGGGSGAG